MVFSGVVNRRLGLALISLLAIIVLLFGGCEDFSQWSPTPSPTAKTEPPATPPTVITTEDRAILAVHEHLLSQAESYRAKVYLADFRTASNRWSAKSELLKDGTGLWQVVVDMSGVVTWEERAYWQQASWFVFRDGKVIPSPHFQANALRIEADLQELSLQTGKGNEPLRIE